MANTDKLPVWGIMILTYRFFWAERRQFWLLAVPAIIVVSMLSALAEWSVARAAAGLGHVPDRHCRRRQHLGLCQLLHCLAPQLFVSG
jgi:hypothetical protein